jgi:hypothetical protein
VTGGPGHFKTSRFRFGFSVHTSVLHEGGYPKLTDQIRKQNGYEYNGSVGSHTRNAMNIVPYRAFPPALGERIGHRAGLRMQVLQHKLTKLE